MSGTYFTNCVVTVCFLWGVNVARTNPICKPIGFMDPLCQYQCDLDRKGTFCTELCVCYSSANDTCAVLDFASKEVAEDAKEGTPLFQIPVHDGETWEYQLGRTESVDGTPLLKLQSYLKLLRFADKYEMVLNQPLDVESIYDLYGLALTSLLLKLTCTVPESGDSKTTEVFLIIKPVDEYAPEFKEPLELTLAEDTKVGNVVIFLGSLARDQDVNPSGPELAYFRLWQYLPDASLDGSAYFAMSDAQQGTLVLQKALDYEILNANGATTLYLNVSAADVHGLTTFSTVSVHVGDEDDLPPEFYHPDCPQYGVRLKPCVVAYEAEVSVNYQGPLTRLFPGRIQARDMDSLNATVVFALEEAPRENPEVLEKFTINKTTGQIKLVLPFRQPQIVRLVIVAMQASGNAQTRFTRASLQVTVVREEREQEINIAMLVPVSTATPKTSPGDDKQEEPPLYFIVTLTCGLLFLAIHCVICAVCFKSKGEGRRVSPPPPGETDGSGASLRYNNRGSVINLSTKSPAVPIHTRSFFQASEYAINQDGTISEAKCSLRYASGSAHGDAKFGEKVPPPIISSLSKNALRLSPEGSQDDKSLSKRSTSEKNRTSSKNQDQSIQKDIKNSQVDDAYANSGLLDDSGDGERPGSAKISLSSSFSSASSEARIALSPESDGDPPTRPDTNISRSLNNSALGQISPLLSWNYRQPIDTYQLEHLDPKAPITHESIHGMCPDNSGARNDGQRISCDNSSMQSQAEMNVHTSLTPSQADLSGPMTSVSDSVEGTNAEEGPPGKVKEAYVNVAINPPPRVSEMNLSESPQGLYIDSVDIVTGHTALSIFPVEKTSTTTEESNAGYALVPDLEVTPLACAGIDFSRGNKPDQSTQSKKECYIDNDGVQNPRTDLSMFRPFTGPGHYNTRPQTGTSKLLGQVDILMIDSGESQRPHTDHPGERQRKRKETKREKSRRGLKKQDKLKETKPGDSLQYDFVLEPGYITRNKAEEQALRCSQQCVIDDSRAIDHPELARTMNEPNLSNKARVYNEVCSPHGSVGSIRGASMSGSKTHNPPGSVSNLPYIQNKFARLDRSRLQPYMILQHEKQKEIQQQQQQQEQQKYQQLQQRKHAGQRQLLETQKKDQDQVQRYQQHPTLEQQTMQQDPQQRRRQHRHRSLRSVPELHVVTEDTEDAQTVRPLPATAPPLLNSEDTERERDDNGDLEHRVMNWVNSTH